MFPGQIVGTVAGSLMEGSFLTNKDTVGVGVRAELETGRVLNEFTRFGPSVVHDVDIPLSGVDANIDHVMVAGSTVFVFDSKWWAGDLFWSFSGAHFRGMQRFDLAGKKTMQLAQQALTGFFARNNVHGVKFATPTLVVWGNGLRRFVMFRPNGAVAVRGELFASWLRRNVPQQNARADILMALTSIRK